MRAHYPPTSKAAFGEVTLLMFLPCPCSLATDPEVALVPSSHFLIGSGVKGSSQAVPLESRAWASCASEEIDQKLEKRPEAVRGVEKQ